MSVLKILHTADLHLDSPFEGLPKDKAVLRRQRQRGLLKRLAELAKSENVDIVLLAGDLLDSGSCYAETGEELIKTLSDIPAPVFISPGNHDFYSQYSLYSKLKFPENVHIFKNNRIECVNLPGSSARVWGAAFTDKYSSALLEGFSATKTPDTLDIMCIHGEVARDSQYNPISEKSIADSGMDYIALGHIHKGSGLCRAGSTYYAWPGCPEGRGFDECGDKSVYIVSLGDGKCSVKPVSVASGKYMILPVELGEAEPYDAICAALPENTQNDVYRVLLRGETESAPELSMLTAKLSDRFFALQLRDETTLHRDIWESVGEDSLKGQFLRRLRAVYDSAETDSERKTAVQAARWGIAALDRREEVLRHDD